MVRSRRTAGLVGLIAVLVLAVAFLTPACAQTDTEVPRGPDDGAWRVKQGKNALPYAIFVAGTLTVVFLLIRSSKRA